MRPINIAAVCLLATTAVAQSVVFPSDHATVPNGATSLNWFPFSSSAPFRGQIVYDAWDLELTPGTPITRIGFRQDGASASASEQVVMEIDMGVSLFDSDTLGNDFDNNWSGAPDNVLPQTTITLPALTASTPNAVVWIDLPAPHYVYNGGNLLVEFRVFLNSNGNQAFNYRLDRARFRSERTAGAPGCQHSGGQVPTLTSSATKTGGNWNISLNSAPVNTLIAIFVAPEQPLTTPYPITVPGVPPMDPTCQAQVPMTGLVESFTAMTSASGTKSWSVPVPDMLVFNNMLMTSQVVCFDYFSPGHLCVSNADQIEFGIDPASTILFGANSTSVGTGTLYANYGLVTLFN